MEVPPDVVALWKGRPDSVQLMRRGRHHLYSLRAGRRAAVLKLTPLATRSYEASLAIADWIEFLGKRGVAVCRPIPSIHRRLVEPVITEEGSFNACVYLRAPGVPVEFTKPALWNERLFRNWGRLVGRIHNLSKDYVPQPGHQEMSGTFIQAVVQMVVARGERELADRLNDAWTAIAQLPRTPETYGMLHGDPSHGNFFVSRSRLTLFDFDDAARGWFLHDLAMVLVGVRLGVMPILPPAEGRAFLQGFFEHFLTGYLGARSLDRETLAALPLFLALLNLLHYVGMQAAPSERHEWMDIVEQHARAGSSPLELDLGAAWELAQAAAQPARKAERAK